VRRNFIVIAAIAVMAMSGGFFAAMVLSPAPGLQEGTGAEAMSSLRTEDLVGQRRPDFMLGDLEGSIVSASDFEGQVLLVNFWATWCKPCVEEMPMLSRLQQDYTPRGLRILGIALDDANRARQFAVELGVDYPILVGLTDVVLTGRRYGNRAGMLPYSVLIDGDGIIRWTHLGALKREDLEQQIQAIIGDAG